MRVGDIVRVYGKLCRVFKIRPAGTIDVEEIDGPNAWRISGLRCELISTEQKG
jgi:hypothetical protein